ncbi:unnamed protein product, partial [Amoebophrya sp. A120]|eukprot:GSA120T00009731001.1
MSREEPRSPTCISPTHKCRRRTVNLFPSMPPHIKAAALLFESIIPALISFPELQLLPRRQLPVKVLPHHFSHILPESRKVVVPILEKDRNPRNPCNPGRVQPHTQHDFPPEMKLRAFIFPQCCVSPGPCKK